MITYISEPERELIVDISMKIDNFAKIYEGKPPAVLETRPCKIMIANIQARVGLQTHAWKLLMVILLDPLDLHVHVRKYCAGQLNNNVIEIALKVDLGIPDLENSDVQIIDQGSPDDEFSSDLDQEYLTSVLSPTKVANQSCDTTKVATQKCDQNEESAPGSPIVAAAPSMHSTVMEGVPVVEVTLAVESQSDLAMPSLTSLPIPNATSTSRAPRNPRKKLKLQLDRDVALDLARSLNSFASMLQLNDDSSGDSFEVLPDPK